MISLKLLGDCATTRTVQFSSSQSEEYTHSNDNLQPLLAVYEEKGPKVFLKVALQAVQLGAIGLLLAWAWSFSEERVDLFIENIKQGKKELVDYVNKQAALFECFPENPKVGRAHYRDDNQAQSGESTAQTYTKRQSKQKQPTYLGDNFLWIIFSVLLFMLLYSMFT